MNAPSLQAFEPDAGLSDSQRRCLDTHMDERSDALAQAVRALCEAQASEPRTVTLQAPWEGYRQRTVCGRSRTRCAASARGTRSTATTNRFDSNGVIHC